MAGFLVYFRTEPDFLLGKVARMFWYFEFCDLQEIIDTGPFKSCMQKIEIANILPIHIFPFNIQVVCLL